MLLSLIVFVPAAGALMVAALPAKAEGNIRVIALAWSIAAFVVSLFLFTAFKTGQAGFQFVESLPWISSLGISYKLGVDGISLFLVLLTTFLFPLCILHGWSQPKRVKEFAITLLVTETAVLGVFLALDLVLFYVFWEGMLIPMYLLIGVWGYERRIYATIKFFLFTLLGGLLMLVAIIALYIAAGKLSFDYSQLLSAAPGIAITTQRWLFVAFAIAFAIKVPVFGFHTWLPDAHTEAPTAGSVILAGVLLKMGTYGFLRFGIPLFPEVASDAAPILIALAVIGIIYAGAVSIVQKDLKRLVAYSSVSHLGFVMLGMFAFTIQAGTGATLQMINHGLATGALFFLVGMLYERRHTRNIGDFGGINKAVPVLGGIFLVSALASLGLPGLNGFAGEFLILLGTFQVNRPAAILGSTGVILAAIYLLWAYQRVFHGPATGEENKNIADLNLRERFVLAPILAVIVLIGVWPQPFLSRIEPSVGRVLSAVRQ